MKDVGIKMDTQLSNPALLQLCKRLERAWNVSDILEAMSPVAQEVLGYPHVWLGLFGQETGVCSLISHVTSGVQSRLSHQTQSIVMPMADDPMLQEIMSADRVVVVEDARTDPRTNKEVVAQLHSRTIVNVPLVLAEQRLGTLGMGTYGDVEGVRPPLPWQIEFMQTMAAHVAVALDRVHYIHAFDLAEDALYQEKERLKVTLDSISDAVISTSASGELLYLNPVAEALTGWTFAQAVDRPYQEVFLLDASNGLAPQFDLVAESVRAAETQRYGQLKLLQRPNGSVLVDAVVSPVRDADGEV